MLREDAAENHHIHGRLVVADDNGRVSIQFLLADDLVGDTTGFGSQERKESGDDVIDRITLVQDSADERDKATGDGHEQSGEKDDDTL